MNIFKKFWQWLGSEEKDTRYVVAIKIGDITETHEFKSPDQATGTLYKARGLSGFQTGSISMQKYLNNEWTFARKIA